MEAKITYNERHQGINVSFEKKPETSVLDWLRGKGFKWNPYEKNWYKKYTDQLHKEVVDYFAQHGVEADASDTNTHKADGTPKTYRRLNLEQLFKSGTKPRKDVIIREIKDGKMEYAAYKHFNGMIDMEEQNDVDNSSFTPAEDGEYLITRLERAKGQSHWVYTVYVENLGELGYVINFGDYYIRYKGDGQKVKAVKQTADIRKGDVVQLKDAYINLTKDTVGIAETSDNDTNARLYLGKNLSGQRLVRLVPVEFLNVIETEENFGNRIKSAMMYGRTAYENHVQNVPAHDQRLMEMFKGSKVGDPRTTILTDAWNEGYRAAAFLNQPAPKSEVEDEIPAEPDNYEFDFNGRNKEAETFMQYLIRAGVTELETIVGAINMLRFTFKGLRFLLFDNGGEFKIDDVTVNTRPVGEIYFSAGEKQKSLSALALEVFKMLKEHVEKYTDTRIDADIGWILINGIIIFNSVDTCREFLAQFPVLKIAYHPSNVSKSLAELVLGDRSLPTGYYAIRNEKENGAKYFKALTIETVEYYRNKGKEENEPETVPEPPAVEAPPVPEKDNSVMLAQIKARTRTLQLRLRLNASKKKGAVATNVQGFGGKKINPHPEVIEAPEALREVLKSYPDIDYLEGVLLAETFQFYKDIDPDESDGGRTVYPDAIKDDEVIERLDHIEKTGLLYWNGNSVHPAVTLTPQGAEFVQKFLNRYETRKSVKEGTDLFPESAGIPELKYDNEKEFAEGGTVAMGMGKQFMAVYELAKNAKTGNVLAFANTLNITNQFNLPLYEFCGLKKIPVIKLDQKALDKSPMFRLAPPPKEAIFYCMSGNLAGRWFNNLYISVMPASYLGIGDYAIKLKQPFAETLENAYTHEVIHAYINECIRHKVPTLEKEIETLREYMHAYINLHAFEFTDFEKGVWMSIHGRPFDKKQPHFSEMITYPFTMRKLKEFFQKMVIPAYNMTAWDRLINLVSTNDPYGHLILYAQKYGDIPKLVFARSVMKYQKFQKEGFQEAGAPYEIMEGGGMVHGKSHKEGGVPLTVKSTGENVELEGGEAVIKKSAVQSKETYEFEGKEQTPKQILNEINTDFGGRQIK